MKDIILRTESFVCYKNKVKAKGIVVDWKGQKFTLTGFVPYISDGKVLMYVKSGNCKVKYFRTKDCSDKFFNQFQREAKKEEVELIDITKMMDNVCINLNLIGDMNRLHRIRKNEDKTSR